MFDQIRRQHFPMPPRIPGDTILNFFTKIRTWPERLYQPSPAPGPISFLAVPLFVPAAARQPAELALEWRSVAQVLAMIGVASASALCAKREHGDDFAPELRGHA